MLLLLLLLLMLMLLLLLLLLLMMLLLLLLVLLLLIVAVDADADATADTDYGADADADTDATNAHAADAATHATTHFLAHSHPLNMVHNFQHIWTRTYVLPGMSLSCYPIRYRRQELILDIVCRPNSYPNTRRHW